MHFSIDRTVHTTAFDKPVVDHWLERKIAQTAAGTASKADTLSTELHPALAILIQVLSVIWCSILISSNE